VNHQLPLNFRLGEESTLNRFIPGGNVELLSLLKRRVNDSANIHLYIYGPSGAGKTHLLQGSARECKTVFYLPLAEVMPLKAGLFNALEGFELVCIDDVDKVAGNDEIEVELFNLINLLRELDRSYIFSARKPPDQNGFSLKDLVSRLKACVRYKIHEPEDHDKRAFLRNNADMRGIHLPDEVIDWIMFYTPRDMKSLSSLMTRLDIESLREQRRITIPFVKHLLVGLNL